MNEYSVELFVDSGDEENTEIAILKKQEMEKWKRDMESRALSEYYKQKITYINT